MSREEEVEEEGFSMVGWVSEGEGEGGGGGDGCGGGMRVYWERVVG